MRIAYLTTEFGDTSPERGGLGNYLARLAPLMVEAGHDCEVFLCPGGAGEGEPSESTASGVMVHRLSYPAETPFEGLTLPGQVRRHLRSAWAIAERLAEISEVRSFDAVQVPNYGVSGLFVDVEAPMAMRFSSHAPTWHAATGRPPDARTLLGEILQRKAIEAADEHFAPSRFVADRVESEVGIPVKVVHPPAAFGADRSEWDPAWVAEAAGDASFMLHAGRLGRAKGTDLVVASAEEFLAALPKLQLHFCGPDGGAGPAIARLGKRFQGRVHFHGRVTSERLHPLMERAEAVLITSRADNLPNVAIEAMSLGTPVIGVRGASLDELVVDGESGFLVDPESPTALSSATQRFIRLTREDRKALGSGARERMARLLDVEASVAAHLAIYASVAARGARPRRDRMGTALHLRADLAAIDHLAGPPARPNLVDELRAWLRTARGRFGR